MNYQLAQLNIAQMRYPAESPELADFMDNLDRINGLAEAAPGFIWRLQDETGNATALRPFGDDMLVNVSVWSDVDSLRQFVFKTAHSDIMKRRAEWFDRVDRDYVVLWWVPEGHLPTEKEAGDRLQLLRVKGPSQDAFSFRQVFDPPA